jgi:hypothetical protein
MELCDLNWAVQLTHWGHTQCDRSKAVQIARLRSLRAGRAIIAIADQAEVKPLGLAVTLQAYRKRKGWGGGRHLRDNGLGGLLYIRLSRFPNP